MSGVLESLFDLDRVRVRLEIHQERLGLRVYLNTGKVLQPPVGEVELERLLGDFITECLDKGFQVSEEILQGLGRTFQILGDRLAGAS
jgi:hypothetical protein